MRQVWMGWDYGKWQRGRSVSEWHQTFIRVLKSASRPDGRCTVKCMLLQKGAVNYCGCISRIEGAYIRIVGASAPTKRYKITPLIAWRSAFTAKENLAGGETRRLSIAAPSHATPSPAAHKVDLGRRGRPMRRRV